MSEQLEPRVGMRIRALRNRQGLSLRALSGHCGLSINAISQIERGESSPTLSSLHVLATALGVPLTAFLEDDNEQTVVFLKRHQRQRSNGKGFVMESMGASLPDQQLEPFLVAMEPGAGSAVNPITHLGEEFVYCLDGEIEYRIGDRLYRLEPGDSLLFEATQPHCFCNRTETRGATVLLVFQSAEDGHLARQRHLNI
jgi:transcriptional regulator with XRE-family HTH domain